MTPLEEPLAYLDAVSVGIKHGAPAELPSRLREIARNLEALAMTAENYLTVTDEPDDYY